MLESLFVELEKTNKTKKIKTTVTVFNSYFTLFVKFYGVNTPTEANIKLICDVTECGVGKLSSSWLFPELSGNNKIRKQVR